MDLNSINCQKPSAGTTTNNSFMSRFRGQWVNALLFVGCVGWAGGLASCNSSSTTGTLGDWTKGSSLDGVARTGASSFVIGTIAYLGTGVDSDNNRLTDFWAYDPSKNAWTQKANYAGVGRIYGVGFAAANKGYIGTGTNANGDRLKDFYEYDPSANTWKKIADFGGSARRLATAFSINNIGYVGTGFDGNFVKDMWSYNPTTASWVQVASYGGDKRVGAIAFVIDGKAYMGTGNNNGTVQRDWWMYDPTQNLWTQKLQFTTDQAAIARSYGTGFAINGKGYIVAGVGSGATSTPVWQYDPATDTWTTLGVFEGADRQYAQGFAIGNKGYVTTGGSTSRADDLWIFDPTVTQNTDAY